MTALGFVTFKGIVHPWMCDAMGHVNVRHYAAMFDDASFQLLGRIAGTGVESSVGWADVRSEVDYKHETRAGALITIHSHVEKIGKSSLTYIHVMTGSLDGVVRAQARVITVRFDLAQRQKIDLAGALRTNAEALLPSSSTFKEN